MTINIPEVQLDVVGISPDKDLIQLVSQIRREEEENEILFNKDVKAVKGKEFLTFDEFWHNLPSGADNSEYAYRVYVAANVKVINPFSIIRDRFTNRIQRIMTGNTYWAYCPDGKRVDTKTQDFDKANQICALYGGGFVSDRTYYWENGDWTTKS